MQTEKDTGNEDFVILTQVDEEPEGLEGEPLTLKEVKKLCPNHFVRDSLFAYRDEQRRQLL